MYKQASFPILLILFVLFSSMIACAPAPAPAQSGGSSSKSTPTPTPTPTHTPTPTPVCPPLGQNLIATVGPADSSSIEVSKNTYAMYDPGSTYWCKPGELKIQSVPVATVTACKVAHANCLGEVEIKPDVNILNTPWASTPPVLSYDFSAHATPTRHPETCKNTTCYAFYRLDSTNTWVWAGWAKGVNNPPKWYAQGDIIHFSLYAVVELPPAQPITPPRNLTMVVASNFLGDGAGGMGVALRVVTDDQQQLQPADELLFHFTSVELDKATGDVPENCRSSRPAPDLFSCLFPIGTSVNLILGIDGAPNRHVFMLVDKSFGQGFSAIKVEIFN